MGPCTCTVEALRITRVFAVFALVACSSSNTLPPGERDCRLLNQFGAAEAGERCGVPADQVRTLFDEPTCALVTSIADLDACLDELSTYECRLLVRGALPEPCRMLID